MIPHHVYYQLVILVLLRRSAAERSLDRQHRRGDGCASGVPSGLGSRDGRVGKSWGRPPLV